MAGFNTITLFIILAGLMILSVSTPLAARNHLTITTSSVTPSEPKVTITQHNLAPITSFTKDEEKGKLGIEEDEEKGKLGIEEDEEDECGGLEMNECLMRRSMVAHTDYIYTQDINNGP